MNFVCVWIERDINIPIILVIPFTSLLTFNWWFFSDIKKIYINWQISIFISSNNFFLSNWANTLQTSDRKIPNYLPKKKEEVPLYLYEKGHVEVGRDLTRWILTIRCALTSALKLRNVQETVIFVPLDRDVPALCNMRWLRLSTCTWSLHFPRFFPCTVALHFATFVLPLPSLSLSLEIYAFYSNPLICFIAFSLMGEPCRDPSDIFLSPRSTDVIFFFARTLIEKKVLNEHNVKRSEYIHIQSEEVSCVYL